MEKELVAELLQRKMPSWRPSSGHPSLASQSSLASDAPWQVATVQEQVPTQQRQVPMQALQQLQVLLEAVAESRYGHLQLCYRYWPAY